MSRRKDKSQGEGSDRQRVGKAVKEEEPREAKEKKEGGGEEQRAER